MKSLFNIRLLVTFCLILLPTSLIRAQGSLTPPPGAPAPTMKTLDQIEARKPVQSLAAAAPYTISQPGSYYLTGNITVASGDAIIIASDDVSLDLNGFTIRSTQTGGASGAAVSVPLARLRLKVRNGLIVSGTVVPGSGAATVAGFAFGISVTFTGRRQMVVSDVCVSGAGSTGIWLNYEGVVERCTVAHCGSRGVVAGVVRDCVCEDCYDMGVEAGRIAEGCRGNSRTGPGVKSFGHAVNCSGSSSSGAGVLVEGNATNCSGQSGSSPGIIVFGNAANCLGDTTTGTYAMNVTGTASFCRGERFSAGIAILAGNAIGCTVDNGTVSAPLKSLGTP